MGGTNVMDNCIKCIHNEVCLYIWKFTFKGTSSRKEIYKDLNTKKHCGHYLESEKLNTDME